MSMKTGFLYLFDVDSIFFGVDAVDVIYNILFFCGMIYCSK